MNRVLISGLTLLTSINCFAGEFSELDCRSINPLKNNYSLLVLPDGSTNAAHIILLKNLSEPLCSFQQDMSPFENISNYKITGSDSDDRSLSVHFKGRFARVRLERSGFKTIKALMFCRSSI